MHFHETIFQLSSCSIWYMMKYYVWFLQKKKRKKKTPPLQGRLSPIVPQSNESVQEYAYAYRQVTWLPRGRADNNRDSYAATTATAKETSLKKWRRAAANFIALIPSCSIRQMLAIFSAIWILKDCNEVQEKSKKVVVLCFHILFKTWN